MDELGKGMVRLRVHASTMNCGSEFFGAEDLAAKLLELSTALPYDWRALTQAVEG